MRRIAAGLFVLLLIPTASGEDSAIDPAQIVGTPPKLPLQSQYLARVEEGYDHAEEAGELELEPLSDVLTALRSSSPEFLQANVDPEATYVKMMNKPEEVRGHISKFEGVLALLSECDFVKNESGLKKYWRGCVFGKADGQLLTFISITKPADDIKPGARVELTGYFFKRYAFLNLASGTKASWAPLLLVRRPILIPQTPANKISLDPEVMKMLPRETADHQVPLRFRMIIQLKANAKGIYEAWLDGQRYTLVQGEPTLIGELLKRIGQAHALGYEASYTGTESLPVRLRMPGETPMREVERAIMTLAQARLVNVNYMQDPPTKAARRDDDVVVAPKPVPRDQMNITNVYVSKSGGKLQYKLGDNEFDYDDFVSALKKETHANPGAYSVRTSYDPDIPWSAVMAVFDACTRCGIQEYGLIPLRSDRAAPTQR